MVVQYLAFMTDANSKLNAHIFELRSSKEDLVSAEVAMTAELTDTDVKLKSLLAQQAELGAIITDTSTNIDITRKNLSDVSEQLLEQDRLRGQLTQDAGASALDRDKLRAEQVRYFEQVEALRRELLTTVRRLVDLNTTVSHVQHVAICNRWRLLCFRYLCSSRMLAPTPTKSFGSKPRW
jgi:chromosome segregation ATPase